MRSITLGQLFELKYGKSLRKDRRVQGEVPVYGSNGAVDYHNESLVRKATIVVGRKGSIGEVHLVSTPCWPIDTTYFVESRGKYDYDLEWLYRLLKTLRLQELNRSAAIPGLNRDDVYRIKIRLPPLDDQKRIAHLLGKVEELIAQRKKHLQQLDDLLKSVFLEMFGDNLRDEYSYEPITKACDFIDYRGKTPQRVETGIPLFSAKCVRCGYFDAERLDYVSEETYKKIMTRGLPKANDVLFTTEGATFGYTCRIPRHFEKFSVGQRLITMRCKNGYQPEVLEFVLNNQHIQKKLASRLSGSAALGIRSAELVKVAIPFPASTLQKKFASIVEKAEGLKSRYQQNLTDLESLYGALSQKAFKGELDLSRVIVTMDKEEPAEVMEPITTKLPDTQPVIELPAPDSVAGFFSAEGRKALLGQWLEVYLDQLGSMPFSAQHFMETAQQRMVELLEELQEPESLTTDYEFFRFGPHEYDHVKELIFQALESGHLAQTYDEAGNRVQLTMAKG